MGKLKNRVHILVVLFICVAQAKIELRKYKKLGPGQNITGTILEEFTSKSKLKCSDRCSRNDECGAYQYTGTGLNKCLLIYRNSTTENGLTFSSNGQVFTYKKECWLDCQNQGRCVEGNDVYKCWCQEDFYGRNCEHKDECYSDPCVYGNCTDYVEYYSCSCTPGYTGINCETEINECQSMPCVHGNCSDNIDNYTCHCNPGFTGINCETDVDECESDPCVHGNCSDNINNYTCHCHSGYTGINCETDIDECESMPCVHGNCSDKIDNYTCECSPGFAGVNCENDLDECDSMPCTTHSSCENKLNSYICHCHEGYTGIICETEINECDSMPCMHGNCTDNVDKYTCLCPVKYTGINCETGLNGECTSSESWTSPNGWTGPDPTAYISFNTLDCLTLMEGTHQANWAPIVGKINNAIFLNQEKKQWVDLNILAEACVARPETCTSAGGAIAFWVKLTTFADVRRGIVLSGGNTTTHFEVYVYYLEFAVYLSNGRFSGSMIFDPYWEHVVLNYIGPDDGEGIQIYLNGMQYATDDTKETDNYSPGDGKVVVGRYYTNFYHEDEYEGVSVDELLFFNTKLDSDQITAIASAV